MFKVKDNKKHVWIINTDKYEVACDIAYMKLLEVYVRTALNQWRENIKLTEEQKAKCASLKLTPDGLKSVINPEKLEINYKDFIHDYENLIIFEENSTIIEME